MAAYALGLCGIAAWASRSSQAVAQADPSPSTPADAGLDAAAAAPKPELGEDRSDPRIAQIRALIAGTLGVDVEPQSLFDASLTDPDAIRIATIRERSLLDAAAKVEQRKLHSPGAELVVVPNVTLDGGLLQTDIEAVDPARWADQVALARARLDFYRLAPQQREHLQQEHRARQEAARPQESEQQRRARQAELDRERALEEARAARTEAERLVSEEKARLIALQAHVDALTRGFDAAEEQLQTERDAVIGWQRRAREAKHGSKQEADATYDALRRALRSARDALSDALDALQNDASNVPAMGPDALANVPAGVDTKQVQARRRALQSAIVRARARERSVREHRAETLLETIDSLNQQRLELLPHLSSRRRNAALDFGPEGWEQASAEARHLSLILRYHRHVAAGWPAAFRSRRSQDLSLWKLSAALLPMVLLTWSFLWVRRRVPRWVTVLDEHMGEAERARRQVTATPARRSLRFFAKVHRPLLWLAYFWALQSLLPDNARGLLELQLVTSSVGWILGGALVVNVINAIAAGPHEALTTTRNTIEDLRLRSLQIVGRTTVAFALVLVLSARLVGKGTIYGWVFSTCWFAAIPVFLVLVRLWRDVVFERVQQTPTPSRAQAWVLANRTGWKSFLAAMVGAVQLFSLGAYGLMQDWVTGFDLVRRVHAYLFRLELTRLSEGSPSADLVALDDAAREALSPERPTDSWLPNANDELLQKVDHFATRGTTSVVAVIGARGMGKSTFLREIERRAGGFALLLRCEPTHTLERLEQQLRERSQSAPERASTPQFILLDNAELLVRPTIGGLADFDQLLSMARADRSQRTWVLAIDASVWPFLRRARDSRPMFEEVLVLEPWHEAEIGALLERRTALAGIRPVYDDLLERTQLGAPLAERTAALQERRVGYIRMLWDYVGGNPALALEVWRNSLGRDALGTIHVRLLQTPDEARIEGLSDGSMFVLRAVLQLDPACIEDIAQVTRLAPEQVRLALRFGEAEGYYGAHEGRARVSWRWLRPVLRMLERRHLLESQ